MMKKFVFILVSVGILFSCDNDDNSNTESDLIGEWKLIETLQDPGGGTGTFVAVDSDKIITFNSDGTLTSNGNLCTMSPSAENPTSGTYSMSNMTLNLEDCIDLDYDFPFEQNGDILIINYPCIEPCRAKYQKQ